MIVWNEEENGEATNRGFARVCPDGYESMEGDRLPPIEDLHTDEYKQWRLKQKPISDAKQWLLDNDWKYNQNQRRVSRGTITSEQETEFQSFLDEADKKAQLVPKSS